MNLCCAEWFIFSKNRDCTTYGAMVVSWDVDTVGLNSSRLRGKEIFHLLRKSSYNQAVRDKLCCMVRQYLMLVRP